MALFKYKNGGICEVYSKENIDRLRKNPDYKEVKENKEKDKTKIEENKTNDKEVKENKK